MKIVRSLAYAIGALFLLPVVLISVLIIYWEVRTPPSFQTDPVLNLETWTAVPSGGDPRTQHNSNTDLTFFDGSFFLVHAQTKWHLQDKHGALLVKRSPDAKNWETVARITVPDTDVRDPKFAFIGGKLFIYFLPNTKFDPEPETTFYTVSDDGINWSTPKELDTVTIVSRHPDGTSERITEGGWQLWRPKTRDNQSWYVIASGKKPALTPAPAPEEKEVLGADVAKHAPIDVDTITVLFRTTDGIHWDEVSDVYTTYGNGEPCLEFAPDGTIVATLRCGSLGTGGYAFGNATGNTIIAESAPPYEKWCYAYSFITRLDGATLFPLEGRIFAAGRDHLGPRSDMGNHIAKKRTALYEVKRDRLVFLFDLPSNGDTAYTGVVRRGDDIYVSYYTCPIEKDYPWIIGICFIPKTEIRMARFSAKGLLTYADKVEREGY